MMSDNNRALGTNQRPSPVDLTPVWFGEIILKQLLYQGLRTLQSHKKASWKFLVLVYYSCCITLVIHVCRTLVSA